MQAGLGYWTARIVVPVVSFGSLRVQPLEGALSDSGNTRVLAAGPSAVFGAFVFAALVTGIAVIVTGGQL